MLITAQPRSNVLQRRPLPQGLLDALPEGALADKGPKHVGFDAPFFGAGRRGAERAQRLDRKR
ncbi:hypothetical protein [Inhella crocodyli]|jgi:hypothetical protein|uniref:Uncharacterized protein n=1 Tax=Inhella crocodyli TaxID=2499851 RepID=A0A437LE18_9BURK|nr:hypothetical protein [Inhella crocodyli]RVT83612.1 hypothetical protein EOD73_13605 [Inhella crocodyli]